WMRAHWDDLNGGPRRFLRTLKAFVDDLIPGWFATTACAAQDVDLIVSANQFAARSVAEKRRVPLVCVAYSPTLFRSAHHGPIFLRWQNLPRWMNRVLWAASDKLLFGLMKPYINAGRAQLGLAPVRSVPQHLFEGVPYLLACDAELSPQPPD